MSSYEAICCAMSTTALKMGAGTKGHLLVNLKNVMIYVSFHWQKSIAVHIFKLFFIRSRSNMYTGSRRIRCESLGTFVLVTNKEKGKWAGCL